MIAAILAVCYTPLNNVYTHYPTICTQCVPKMDTMAFLAFTEGNGVTRQSKRNDYYYIIIIIIHKKVGQKCPLRFKISILRFHPDNCGTSSSNKSLDVHK